MVTTAEARLPDGLRIYAVGDVHGCLGMLETMQRWIDADIAARPPADWREIHVGDYIDRGPDSRGVIEALIERARSGRCICLRGNHDQFLIDFLTDPRGRTTHPWLAQGGVETLASYGVAVEADRVALRDRLFEAMPEAHRSFLVGLPYRVRFVDYVFVHAGLRPGVALALQDAEDMIWIREPFLSDTTGREVVTVHGHTPVDAIEVRPHRIGIDTGAVHGGHLSCLVLEASSIARLGAAGPLSLTESGEYD